jgi:hypothetical protein
MAKRFGYSSPKLGRAPSTEVCQREVERKLSTMAPEQSQAQSKV